MHLLVPVQTQQVQKVDLNWTFLFCSHENGMVHFQTGPISGLHPNFGHILDQLAGFFPYPCVNSAFLPTGFLEWTRADQYAIAPMVVWTGPTQMLKICIWPIE